MTYHDEIIVDNSKAHDYAMKYLAIVLHNMNAQGLMITSAMAKFAKFLDLPEIKTFSVWELATSIIATAVPAFRFMKMLSEEEKVIEKAAVEVAAALGDRRAKLIKAGQKIGEAKEKIKTVTEPASKVKENLDALEKAPPPGITELQKLDSSKKVIHELIEASKKALVVWAKTLDLINLELENRLSDLDHRAPETILAKITRLLALPAYPTTAELDEIETACLWKMIGDWASKNVYWLETTTMIHTMGATTDRVTRGGTRTTLEGINDNQLATIASLFGIGVRRGKYFTAPLFYYGVHALGFWNISTQTKTVYSHQVTPSGKM